ncbi:MAG: ubiquinone biosynthesis methyltransferase UbiE [Rhizobiales bacterium]|nr:ubiquinone biosynthesis methyltransferase UbiE [Hyphomicrobiales bacterium]
MSRMREAREDGYFAPLLSIDLDIAAFASNWSYCDRLSSYFARMISHNRTDSLLYANLFSSALNELLETVFRVHGAAGNLTCRVSRHAERDRIELTVPCGKSESAFYQGAVANLVGEDIEDRYRAALFREGPMDAGVGLLELAVDYGADFSVEAMPQAIRLVAELSLEGRRS